MLWRAHADGASWHHLVLIAPDKSFEQTAEVEAEFLTVIELDIRADDGVCHPFARHGVQVTPHTSIHAKVLVESDVCIAAIISVCCFKCNSLNIKYI